MRKAIRSAAINAVLIRECLESGVAYNPLSSRVTQDPYPVYAKLRARDPVHRSRLFNGWVFTRHAVVDAILRNHRHFSNDSRKGALTRRAVNALEPHIRDLLGALLDEIGDPAGFDLMAAVAQPLPVIVIAEMLGIPPEDRAQFKLWSDQRARLIEPTTSKAQREIGKAASNALDAYVRPIISARRVDPQGDIVSALALAEERGERLTEREMLNMLRLLLVAGNETTTNLIGNGMLALLRHPEQLERLRQDPSMIPSAVEELLRFDSPVQTDFRRALEDCEVNGFPVRRREEIVAVLGAANRDPEVFEYPDRLDVGRREIKHLSFGRGIHHCLGAPLARLEGRIVLEELLQRFSSIRLLNERPRFHDTVVLRGLRSLPIGCLRA